MLKVIPTQPPKLPTLLIKPFTSFENKSEIAIPSAVTNSLSNFTEESFSDPYRTHNSKSCVKTSPTLATLPTNPSSASLSSITGTGLFPSLTTTTHPAPASLLPCLPLRSRYLDPDHLTHLQACQHHYQSPSLHPCHVFFPGSLTCSPATSTARRV